MDDSSVSQTTMVMLPLCDGCLDGLGGECRSPGCALWNNRAPDLPLRNNPMVELHQPAELAQLRERLAKYEAGGMPLVPTENRGIADTGDVEECCVVCGAATDGGHTARECFENAMDSESQVSDYHEQEAQTLRERLARLAQLHEDSAKVIRAMIQREP